jgi:hypothetical protein
MKQHTKAFGIENGSFNSYGGKTPKTTRGVKETRKN